MQRVVTREDIRTFFTGQVQNVSHYVTAFVRKSALKEFPHLGDSYERLEFIGDSVVNFIIGKYLFDRYPTKKEGFLTRIRTKIVSGKCLCEISRALGLYHFVFMDHKGIRNGWNENDRICEDVFEAFVGALYLDLGLVAARDFVISCTERFIDFEMVVHDTNYKDILMRWTQATGIPLPEYAAEEVRRQGMRMFEVACIVDGVESGRGLALSKKDAEQMAAMHALRTHAIDVDECRVE